MELIQLLSWLTLIVGVIMPLGYALQAFKIVKNKSSKNISISAFLFFEFAFIIWLTYGLVTRDIIIISSYAVGIICVTSTIVAYFVYRKRN